MVMEAYPSKQVVGLLFAGVDETSTVVDSGVGVSTDPRHVVGLLSGSSDAEGTDSSVAVVDGPAVRVVRVVRTQRPAQFSPRVAGQEGSEAEQDMEIGQAAMRKPQGGPMESGGGVVAMVRVRSRVVRERWRSILAGGWW